MPRGPKEAKPPVARKPPKDADSRVRDLEKRLAEAVREKAEAVKREAEALERETAASEILRIISGSPADVQPVLDAVAESAARLCAADDAVIWRLEGDRLRAVAHHGPVGHVAALVIPVLRGTVTGRSVLDRQTVQVTDLQAEVDEFPEGSAIARQFGHRSIVSVPLLREGVAIGVIALRCAEVQPFTEKQIALLKTFADQAVIAIENVRLFKELEARNRDLTESLDQQTATSEIRRVISSSPTDVQPVFDAIVRSAVRLLDGLHGVVDRFDGELIHFAAQYNYTPEALQMTLRMYPRQPDRKQAAGRAILTGDVVNIADAQADPEYATDLAVAGGWRSILNVPMLREGKPIGTIGVIRGQAGRFSDAQVELLRTFADQAVIAIENVRLFTELQEKNRALTDALEQRTATSEILSVISQSPTDVQPVFDTIVQSGARLCNATTAAVVLSDGTMMRVPANYGRSPEVLAAARALWPRPLDATTSAGMAILAGSVVQIPDSEDPSTSEFVRHSGRLLGYRSSLAVPMLRGAEAIGAIRVTRRESGRFSAAEIQLLQPFPDQPGIAIGNVGLVNETKEALERQTATSEILKVIASSPTDVQPVFDAIARQAMRLCSASYGVVTRYDGQLLYLVAHAHVRPEGVEAMKRVFPMLPSRATTSSRAILERAVVHVPDAIIDPDYAQSWALGLQTRSVLAVPMLHSGEPIGTISVGRFEPQPFTEAQIALLQTFADQAVIAIENVRLFKELEAKTQELTRSVGELRALSEVGETISSTLDLQAVLSTIAAQATQLSGTDAGVIYEYDELREVFVPRATEHLEAEIIETMLATPVRKGEGATGRLADVHEPIEVPDIVKAPADSRVRSALVQAGY